MLKRKVEDGLQLNPKRYPIGDPSGTPSWRAARSPCSARLLPCCSIKLRIIADPLGVAKRVLSTKDTMTPSHGPRKECSVSELHPGTSNDYIKRFGC
jgi:hypothetical protein